MQGRGRVKVGPEGGHGRQALATTLQDSRENEGVPKYVQLARTLREKVASGEYAAGASIPTEDALGSEHGVSRITVREAVNRLVQENLLQRKQGKGTFVLPPKLRRDAAKVYSFSDDMLRLGLRPDSRVLELEVVEADPDAAELLRLPGDHQLVTRIRRVRNADGAPVLVETALIPEYLCPGLAGEDLERGSLYDILARRYGLHPSEAEETHEAMVMKRAEAKLLGCTGAGPHAAFAIRRVSCLSDGTPIELTRSVGRGDRLTFGIRMIADQADFQRLVGFAVPSSQGGAPRATRDGGRP